MTLERERTWNGSHYKTREFRCRCGEFILDMVYKDGKFAYMRKPEQAHRCK